MTPLADDPRRLAAVYRVVARLVSAGIPPIQRASALRDTPHRGRAGAVTRELVEVFTSGGLPSAALARSGVPRAHVEAVAIGETTGRLDVMFDLLASWCEEQARVRSRLLAVLAEPFVAWLVVAFLVPLSRLVSAGPAAYARSVVLVLSIPLLAGLALRGVEAWRGVIPGLGEPLRLLAASRGCRTLGLLNAAGLPLPRSLREAAEAAAHPHLTPAWQQASAAVERGATLAEALRRAGGMRPVELALVADAEATGRLDVAFSRAAELLEREGMAALRWRVRVLGAALFAVVVIVTALGLASAVTGSAGGVGDA